MSVELGSCVGAEILRKLRMTKLSVLRFIVKLRISLLRGRGAPLPYELTFNLMDRT